MRRTFSPLPAGPLGRHDAERLSRALAEIYQLLDIRTAPPLSCRQGAGGLQFLLDTQQLLGGVNVQTGAYTLQASDYLKLVTWNSSAAVTGTLPAASSLGPRWLCAIENAGAGTLTLQPAGLSPPAAPGLSTATGGSMTAGTYQVEVTYTTASGETLASPSSSQAIVSGETLIIASPAFSGDATGWYAYVTQAGGSTYYRQQAAGSPTALGTSLTLTANPTTSGANPPSSNTALGSTIDGASSLSVGQNTGCWLFSDGDNYYTERGAGSGGGSLGILGDSTTYTGAVKLKAGSGVSFADDVPNNAIEISASSISPTGDRVSSQLGNNLSLLGGTNNQLVVSCQAPATGTYLVTIHVGVIYGAETNGRTGTMQLAAYIGQNTGLVPNTTCTPMYDSFTANQGFITRHASSSAIIPCNSADTLALYINAIGGIGLGDSLQAMANDCQITAVRIA